MLRPLIGLAGYPTLTVNSPYKAFPATTAAKTCGINTL